MSKGLKNN